MEKNVANEKQKKNDDAALEIEKSDDATLEKIKNKSQELFHAMKKDFQQSEETKEIYARARNIVEPTLKEWSDAVVQCKFGPKEDREINSDIIKSCHKTIENVKDGASAYLKNYMIDKLISTMKSIALKYILPIVTK